MSDHRENSHSSDDLKKLDERLRRLQAEKVVRDPHTGPVKSTAGADATRYAIEFFGATVFGFGVGWFLDDFFGTRPWIMIVLGILGFAGGVLNVYRAAEEMSKRDKTEAERKE